MRAVIAIDDLPAVLDLVRLAVNRHMRHAVSFHTANNGVTGLELIERCLREHGEPPIVILDVEMPRLKGQWVAVEARRIAPTIQIVPLTGNPATAPVFSALGCRPLLTKPISAHDVAEALDAALDDEPVTTSEGDLTPAPELEASSFAPLLREAVPAVLAQARAGAAAHTIAVFAQSQMLLLGMRTLIEQRGWNVAAAFDDTPHGRSQLTKVCQSRRLSLLVCHAAYPDVLPWVQSLSAQHNIPLLFCAASESIAHALADTQLSIVVEPASPDLLARAIDTVANGGHFRNVSAGLLKLSDKQRRVVEMLTAGDTVARIAQVLGVREDSVRRILSDVYAILKVENQAGLIAWMHAQHR
jgi:DNA-binding NarL/FixJ family response regulator